jgi:hypothetical protein
VGDDLSLITKSIPTKNLLNFFTAKTTATSSLLIVDFLISADLKLLEAAWTRPSP